MDNASVSHTARGVGPGTHPHTKRRAAQFSIHHEAPPLVSVFVLPLCVRA